MRDHPATVTQTGTRENRFLSLRARLLLIFTIIFSLLWAAAAVILYNFVSDAALVRIEDDMRETLQAALGRIDGDEFAGLVAEGEPNDEGYSDDPRYIEEKAWLQTITEVKPYASVYTFVRGETSDQIIYITASDNAIPFGSERLFDPQEMQSEYFKSRTEGYDQTVVDARHTFTDESGVWASGYTPIRNSKGGTVGVLGVDYSAEFIEQVRAKATRLVIPGFAFGYLVGFIVVYVSSTLTVRPLIALTAAARAIARGEYQQDLSRLYNKRLRSEISELAEAIEESGRVHIREQVLIQRVQELQIKIDETKKEHDVEEIVHSEFFQDLKTKAAAMRREQSEEDSEEA